MHGKFCMTSNKNTLKFNLRNTTQTNIKAGGLLMAFVPQNHVTHKYLDSVLAFVQ